MTLTETNPNGARYTDTEARAGATTALRTDPLLTGDALGTMFPRLDGQARSGEWGRKMKRRAAAVPAAGETGTGGGTSASGSAPAPARPRATNGHGTTVPKTIRRAAAPRRGSVPWPLVAIVVLGDLIVLAVTLRVSYAHVRHLAELAGQGSLSAWYPLGVDGLVLVCAGVLVWDRVAGRAISHVAQAGVVIGLAATVAANMLAVEPTAVARTFAAYPPIAAAVVMHLSLRMLGERGTK